MSASLRLPMEEASQCAEARRIALRMAAELGFAETIAGQVAIVTMEAGTNILKHAGSGEILLQTTDSGGDNAIVRLELFSLDKGPGMRDLDGCLEDGYTTGSSPGTGLGAIRRLSNQSDFYSASGQGTAILARWFVALPVAFKPTTQQQGEPLLHAGAVNVSKHGESFCGDSWAIEQTDELSTILLADGLGHGYDANLASMEAVRILRANREQPPALLIDLVHRALRGLRGAAVSIAQIDRNRGKLTFSGLGNVSGQIYSSERRVQHLISVNGTAGHQSARIKEFSYPWPSDGILIMYSDGLSTGASLDPHPGLCRHDPSLIAGVLYRQYSRGNDDATVVVVKTA
jgi:anti-sigma regulatory factor (Ser/Thr protein kinase)